ncbi:MAG: hypothetical protein RBS68_14500 [Anaerolineales bacterium]|jgi:hypothetical protein|nr:hypothetical protein [Anaerolineales bacterium]
MDLPHPFWPAWLDALKQKRLNLWAAWALDAAGPLTVLGAQLIHLSAPLLGNSEQSQALALTLEDEAETRAFITFLRKQP